METIRLTRISRSDKTSKAGKPYVSLGIQCDKYGDQWINGFGGQENADWKEGDEVEVTIEKKTFNGKEYLNFTTPKKADKIQEELTKIRHALFDIKNMLLNLQPNKYPTAESEGIDGEVPF